MKLLRHSTIAILFLLPSLTLAQSIPAFPMAFWGNVTINGSAAPVGTVVRAYYGSTLAGTVTVQDAGVYGYTAPTQQKLVIGEGSGAISFTVQSPSFNSGAETSGTTAITYPQFTSASTTDYDLAFTISVSAPPAPSGGGGGGGGVALPLTTTSATTTASSVTGGLATFTTMMIEWGQTGANVAADLNHDGKVDILDFTLLMINWTN